jgi:hypothetical protein
MVMASQVTPKIEKEAAGANASAVLLAKIARFLLHVTLQPIAVDMA